MDETTIPAPEEKPRSLAPPSRTKPPPIAIRPQPALGDRAYSAIPRLPVKVNTPRTTTKQPEPNMIHADMAPLRGKAIARAGPAALRCGKTPVQGVPSRTRFSPRPTTLPSFHPVSRRPTHRGAGVVPGVQVERATVRTTWTPGAASARLCLGRWRTGWKHPAHTTTGPQSGTAPPPSRCRPIPRRRHPSCLWAVLAVIDSWLPALSTCGRASAAAAPSGPKAGARAQPEPGSAPGGAERSRGLMK